MHGCAPEDYLSDVFAAHKFRSRVRHTFPSKFDDLCTKAFRKAQVRGQRAGVCFLKAKISLYMDDVEFGVHAACHASAPRNQILRGRTGGYTYGNAFPHCPIFADVLGVHIGFQASIDLFSDLSQRELAQSDEIATAKKVLLRLLDLFRAVDITAFHAIL